MGVQLFWALNETKASLAEAVNKTLMSRISKYLFANSTKRYIDHLQSFVEAYNNRPHTSLAGRTPNSITEKNQVEVYNKVFKPKHEKSLELRKKSKKQQQQYKVGDYVRISRIKHVFEKGYSIKYSEEIYKISEVLHYRDGRVYELEDLEGKPLDGTFYMEELSPTAVDSPDRLYVIEKIVKTQKRRDGLWHFIKWRNYPKSQNSWVPAREIVSYEGL
jgi:hypothetical protein